MRDIYRGAPQHNHIDMGADFVQHWKYIKKLKVGKSYRYFYDWDEWKAYLGGDSKAETGVKTSGITATPKQSGLAKSFVENAKKRKNKATEEIKERASKGKKWFSNKLRNKDEDNDRKEKPKKQKSKALPKSNNPKLIEENGVDENGHKYIAKVEINGKYRYFYTQDEYKAYVDREKYIAEEPDFMKGFRHSDVPYTAEEDCFNVNPYYGYDEHFSVNCAECTAIYELRRRGYDVESNGLTGILDERYLAYNTDQRFDIMYEDAKVQYCKPTFRDKSTYEELYSQIDKNPPGSRGDISIQWKTGGGHSMVWEKDLNGKIKIIDTQCSGNGYHTEYSLERLAKVCNNTTGSARIVRTDNLKLKSGITAIFQDSDQEVRQLRKPQGTYTVDKNGGEKLSTLSQKERRTKYPEVGSKINDIAQKANRVRALAAGGKTYAEIAKLLGLSTSTIARYLR